MQEVVVPGLPPQAGDLELQIAQVSRLAKLPQTL
jgi:hypothetical protein